MCCGRTNEVWQMTMFLLHHVNDHVRVVDADAIGEAIVEHVDAQRWTMGQRRGQKEEDGRKRQMNV